MKVFVTGGSGQVGSTVIDMLLGRGDTVLAIDYFATGRRDNLSPHPKLREVEDTIADGALVDRLFDLQFVLHFKDACDTAGGHIGQLAVRLSRHNAFQCRVTVSQDDVDRRHGLSGIPEQR